MARSNPQFNPRNISNSDAPVNLIVNGFAVFLLMILVLYVGWNSFYMVEPHEKAVVLRFGKYYDTVGPGAHFLIPAVDTAIPVSIEENSLRLPSQRDGGYNLPRTYQESESLILTGELNASVVEWTIQWQVVQPEQFLFSFHRDYARDHMQETIRTVSISVMNQVVGDYSLNESLTSRREEIGVEALKQTQDILEQFDCGVRILRLQVQKITPPSRVKPAYDAVVAAIQQQEQAVNEANQERNRLLPRAKASEDRLIREAEGFADRRRAEAQGEISALLAKYKAYQEAPEITRQRLYLEAMEDILSNSGQKVVIDGDLPGLLPFLNLNEETTTANPVSRQRTR
ncbi:Hypothetical protein PBC10988_39490 [Planctomycetales bacterium 10988]|nr:Hypothetical protein PBC10988_39490 [Planctomycetales bacterium 10988]